MSSIRDMVIGALVLVLSLIVILPFISSVTTSMEIQLAENSFNKFSSGVVDAYVNGYSLITNFQVPKGWSIFYYHPTDTDIWAFIDSPSFSECNEGNYVIWKRPFVELGKLNNGEYYTLDFIINFNKEEAVPSCLTSFFDGTEEKKYFEGGVVYTKGEDIVYLLYPYYEVNKDEFLQTTNLKQCSDGPCVCLAYGDFGIVAGDQDNSLEYFDVGVSKFKNYYPDEYFDKEKFDDWKSDYDWVFRNRNINYLNYFFRGWSDLISINNLYIVNKVFKNVEGDVSEIKNKPNFKIRKCVSLNNLFKEKFNGYLFYNSTNQPLLYLRYKDLRNIEIKKEGDNLILYW